MFTLRGPIKHGGRSYAVTWDDGRLTGDDVLVDEARARAAGEELIAVTPTGPFVRASLLGAAEAMATLASLFYSYRAEGDTPAVPALQTATVT